MSHTRSHKHLQPKQYSERRAQSFTGRRPKLQSKPPKQTRNNERAALRKEYK